MNLDSLSKLAPVLTVTSNLEADPLNLLRSIVPLVFQGADGLGSEGILRASTLEVHIGEDIATVVNALKKDGIAVQSKEVDWPLEIWALYQVVQPLLSLTRTNVVAYTCGGKVIGFGGAPPANPPGQIDRLSRGAPLGK